MFNTSGRIYNLGTFNALNENYGNNGYFIFLVNHRSEEMVKKGFFFGLKFNGIRRAILYHYCKLFICNSMFLNKTFDINNYIDFFFNDNQPLLWYKNRAFCSRMFSKNIKKLYSNYTSFFIKKRISRFFYMYFVLFNNLSFFYFYKNIIFYFYFCKTYKRLYFYKNKKNYILI